MAPAGDSGVPDGRTEGKSAPSETLQSAQTEKPLRYSALHSGQIIAGTKFTTGAKTGREVTCRLESFWRGDSYCSVE